MRLPDANSRSVRRLRRQNLKAIGARCQLRPTPGRATLSTRGFADRVASWPSGRRGTPRWRNDGRGDAPPSDARPARPAAAAGAGDRVGPGGAGHRGGEGVAPRRRNDADPRRSRRRDPLGHPHGWMRRRGLPSVAGAGGGDGRTGPAAEPASRRRPRGPVGHRHGTPLARRPARPRRQRPPAFDPNGEHAPARTVGDRSGRRAAGVAGAGGHRPAARR
jgi:hypothetical protein